MRKPVNAAADVRAARALVRQFFVGNESKTDLWFLTPNPYLGNVSPNRLIELGRARKLLEFVKGCLNQ